MVRGLSAEADLILQEHFRGAQIGDILLPLRGTKTKGVQSLRLWPVGDKAGPRRAMAGDWAETGRGLVLASPAGRRMLRGDVGDGDLIIAEGEPDTLACAMAWPSAAVWGIFRGTWSDDLALAASAAARVIIRTDDDQAGEDMAAEVARSLGGACPVYRYRAPRQVEARGKMKAVDQNDLWLAGDIGDGEVEADRLLCCVPYEAPPLPAPKLTLVTTAPKATGSEEKVGDDEDMWRLARAAIWWEKMWADTLNLAEVGGTTHVKGGWAGRSIAGLRAAHGFSLTGLDAWLRQQAKREDATDEAAGIVRRASLALASLSVDSMENELEKSVEAGAGGDKATERQRKTELHHKHTGIFRKAAAKPLDYMGLTQQVDASPAPKTRASKKAKPKAKTTATVQMDGEVIMSLEVGEDGEVTEVVETAEQRLDRAVAVVQDPRRIRARFRTAPVDEQARLPEGYRFDSHGAIWRDVAEDERQPTAPICTAPIFITGISRDQDGAGWREVSWLRLDGGWGSKVVPRLGVTDRAQMMLMLGKELDAPVNSTYASGIVAFLDHYERANAHHLPATRVQTHMGWTEEGGFLLGSRLYISPEGEEVALKEGELPAHGCVSFSAKDTGEASEGRAFCRAPCGTWEGWLDAVSEARGHHGVMYALWASLAAPLVHMLDIPSPIVDWSAPDGSGKTTAIMLAASVWGHPQEAGGGANGQVIRGWDQTQVALEHLCATRAHLPIILNDTKKRHHRLDMGSAIFMLHEGQARGRGTTSGGTHASSGWQSVIMSTGEAKISDYASASDGGIHGRVIAITGSPWGRGDELDRVRRFRSKIYQHWGHLGRCWMSWLCRHKTEHFAHWRSLYHAAVSAYTTEAAGHQRGERLASMAGVIRLAASLAKDGLGLDLDGEATCDAIFRRAVDATSAQRPHEQALRQVFEWSVSNASRFSNPKVKAQLQPNGGWVGRWELDRDHPHLWDEIAFIGVELDKVLRLMGYDAPGSIRDMWAQCSISTGSTEQRRSKDGAPVVVRRSDRLVRVDGVQLRCVVIPRSALVDLGVIEPISAAEAGDKREREELPL
jgi:5S rRNA maturation endonuclease (ribonuclease M5)